MGPFWMKFECESLYVFPLPFLAPRLYGWFSFLTLPSWSPQTRIDPIHAMFQVESVNLEFSLTEGSWMGRILTNNKLQYNYCWAQGARKNETYMVFHANSMSWCFRYDVVWCLNRAWGKSSSFFNRHSDCKRNVPSGVLCHLWDWNINPHQMGPYLYRSKPHSAKGIRSHSIKIGFLWTKRRS